MELVFLIVYFVIIILIGVYSFIKTKSSKDFYIAGKKGGVLGISGSLIATILGSFAILGTAQYSYFVGWASSWFILLGAIGLLVLVPFAKLVTRYGKYTLPEMLETFYGKEAKLFSSIIIAIAWTGIIAAQIIGAQKIISIFFPMQAVYAVLIAGAIIITYTILGGQISIIKTDVFQSILMLGGLLLTFFLLLGSHAKPIADKVPLAFPFNEHFTPLTFIVLLLTYSTTFFVGPDIYSRLFCAKNEKTATKSVLITALIVIPFAFIVTYIGLFAFTHFTIGKGISPLVYVIHTTLPSWASGIMLAALLAAIMSSADTTMLTAGTILSEIFVNPDKKRSILLTRILIVVIGIFSMLVAIKIQSILESLKLGLTVFSGAFIIPTAAGMFGYRTNKLQSNLAMIIGAVVALVGKLLSKKFFGLLSSDLSNYIIISAFVINAVILFWPTKIFRLNKAS